MKQAVSQRPQKLLSGKLDMFLTNTHTEEIWDSCRIFSYGSCEAKVIVSLLHPLSIKSQVTVEDLKQYTFLKMEPGHSNYAVPLQQSFYENIPCRDISHVLNFNTLLTLLAQGDSFAVAPLVFSKADLSKIKSFDYPGKSITFHTALICRNNPEKGNLNTIIQEIVEDFELKEIL